MLWKTCTKCKENKPLYLYNKHRGGLLGHCSYCKACNNIKVRAYRERLRQAQTKIQEINHVNFTE